MKFYKVIINQKPLSTLLVVFPIIIFLLLQIPKLKMQLSVYDINDPHFKSSMDINEMRNNFEDPNSIQVIFHSASFFTQKEFCSLQKKMIHLSRNNPEIAKLSTPSDYRKVSWDGERLLYPSLLKYDCESNEALDLAELKKSPFAFSLLGNNDSFTYEIGFKKSTSDKYGKFDPKPIGEVYKTLDQEFSHSKANYLIGGQSAILWHLKEMVKKDAFVNIFIIIFILALFKFFYGTFSSGVLLIITMLLTCAVSYGAMAALHIPLDLLTNTLFMIILVSSIEDFIFLTCHMADSTEAPFDSFKKLVLPTFMTSLTTCVGFGSLLISDLAIIKRFGLIAAIASIIEWFMIFIVLPALLSFFKMHNYKWCIEGRKLNLSFIEKMSHYKPSYNMTKGLLFVALIFFCTFPLINFNDHPEKKFSSNHPHQKYSDYIDQNFKTQGLFFLLFPKADEAREKEILKLIRQDSNIAAIQSPWEIADYFLKGLPDSIKDLAISDIKLSSFYSKFFSGESSRTIIYLKSIEQNKTGQTIKNLKEICQNTCKPVGELVTYNDFSKEVTATLFGGFSLSLVIVSIIILITCYVLKIKEKWQVMLSILWCPMMMIGVLALLQIPINLVSSIVGSIFIGLTGDNALQYIFSAQRENSNLSEGINKKSAPSLQLAITCSLSCLFFLKFTLIPLREIGVMLMLGFVLITIGDFYILKGLIAKRE